MKNVTCQDQSAESFDVHLQTTDHRPELGNFPAYAEALAWARSFADPYDFMIFRMSDSRIVCDVDGVRSHFQAEHDQAEHELARRSLAVHQQAVVEALAVADQLDAVPDTGADPDLIVEAAASLRLLCCLLDVCGVARGGEGEPRERTATGAALLFTPHGNHGDNQQ